MKNQKLVLAKIVVGGFIHVFVCLFFATNASAKVRDGFVFEPLLSVEYSAPDLTGGGVNSEFRTNNFGKQLSNLQNIALGGNFRVHEFFGFNANWTKVELRNDKMARVGALSREARFSFDQYNFSALTYLPVDKKFELFLEAGISDVNGKLTYANINGFSVAQKFHETKFLYGAGFQVKLRKNSDDAIRFSVQKYVGKIGILNADYATVRLGYLKGF